MKTFVAVILAVISACTASSVNATVRYEFEITSPHDVPYSSPQMTVTGKFAYDSANFIDLGLPDYRFVPAADLASCEAASGQGAATCLYAMFQRSYLTNPVLNFNQVQFAMLDGNSAAGVNAYFADGAFTNPGTHLSIHNILNGAEAKLVVTVIGGAVPEPATWAMMICGFGLVGAGLRQNRARRSALV